MIEIKQKNFLAKLTSGDFGLAITFWCYWALANIVFRFVGSQITTSNEVLGFSIVTTLYSVPVLMGLWRAASRYQGNKVWAILTKIITVLGSLSILLTWVLVFQLMGRA